jgi:hypothetical protein
VIALLSLLSPLLPFLQLCSREERYTIHALQTISLAVSHPVRHQCHVDIKFTADTGRRKRKKQLRKI